ncbi:hypothetical protein [Marivirga arenosa]|uniref:hypothetical protein n=1 Tax=Marivirga arenosa TaxID=3059076 RepID=UPI00265F9704|nr:hypothetical protein [Marivirga sp. BKB1-2]WKK83390.1 hypothetical protein QYS47_28045 [Marivirga sp. BKB1-2]
MKKKSTEDPIITYGSTRESLTYFLQKYTPTFWFANGAQLFQNNLVTPKESVDGISLKNIIPMNWNGFL